MRNVDIVRKMTVEELAELFESPEVFCRHHQGNKVECNRIYCTGCIKEWLKAEVDHGDFRQRT